MIQGILLAAGASRRYGAPKLLQARWQGEPIAQVAVRNLLQVLPDTIAVVADQRAPLAELLRRCGARTVLNAEPGRGMGSSIAAAVAASTDASAWVIALADMPWLHPASIAAVVEALAAGAPLVATRHRGRRGHPVGFAAQYRAQLLQLDGAPGARAILGNAHALREVDVDDPGVILDVDTPADLKRAGRRLDRGQ